MDQEESLLNSVLTPPELARDQGADASQSISVVQQSPSY